MTPSLIDKLTEILKAHFGIDDTIARLHLAFVDAGFKLGGDFYDDFVAAYDDIANGSGMDDDAIEAARRAAGLE